MQGKNIISRPHLTNKVKEICTLVICVEGAVSIRPMSGICFRPFQPERITGHVLAWKKNHAFSAATAKFLDFVQSKYDSAIN